MEQTPKVMTDFLRGLDCNVWVDDVLYFAADEISLLCLLDEIIGRLESVGVHSPRDADDSLPTVDSGSAEEGRSWPRRQSSLVSDDFRSSYLG